MVKRIIGFILIGGLVVGLTNKLSSGLSFDGDKLVDIFVVLVFLLLVLLGIGKILRS